MKEEKNCEKNGKPFKFIQSTILRINMVGEQVRDNLTTRIDAAKDLVVEQIDLTKSLVRDVIDRVNPLSSNIPIIADSAKNYIVKTGDNIENFAQSQSKVNRSWLRR